RSEPAPPSEIDRLLLAASCELAVHPAEDLAKEAEREAVRTALAGLSPDYRTPLQLYYYEEWSVAEIAQFLSLPATTGKWRLHQGRALMRRELAAEEVSNERRPAGERRNPAHATPAAGDGADRQGGEPDRQPREGRPQLRAAVQRAPGAPGADGRRARGALLAAAGGGHLR